MQWPSQPDVLLELIKGLVALLLLSAGWFVGQRIVTQWDLFKKRQESDVAAAAHFQALYGELKEVARLWRLVKLPSRPPLVAPADVRWQLVARATAAESKYESLVIKLASERALSEQQTKTLGLYRQAVQQVRQSIRDDKMVPSSDLGPEYLLFNRLAADVTCLINAERARSLPSSSTIQQSMFQIAAVRTDDWEGAVKATRPEYLRLLEERRQQSISGNGAVGSVKSVAGESTSVVAP